MTTPADTPIRDSLDRERLRETLAKLERRIGERFPNAGLLGVAGELRAVAASIEPDLEYIARPNAWLRVAVVLFIASVLALLAFGLATVDIAQQGLTLADLAGITEAIFNDVILIGAAVLFLLSIEIRRKRQRVVEAVNRLRSLAHVIDMHQLTKDPSMLFEDAENRTAHSPERVMSPFELGRYLDYCTELLSLTSKIGFCYVQDFDDTEAAAAVTELETLTNALARKVWQKIMLLPQSARHSAGMPAAVGD